MSDDYSADRFTTGAVEVGGSATGTIETAYDHDWFAVELVAGRTYQFDLQGSPGGGGRFPTPTSGRSATARDATSRAPTTTTSRAAVTAG